MAALRAPLAILAGSAAACAGAAGAQAAAASPPRAALRGFSCKRGPVARRRSVSVQAVMRPVPGTEAMTIRFDLLERPPASPTINVQSGDLGVWVRPSAPSLGSRRGDVWRLSEPVSGLDAPAAYRFRVSFRWIGAHGRALGFANRYSRGCWQPRAPVARGRSPRRARWLH